jgi:hypothetical protein
MAGTNSNGHGLINAGTVAANVELCSFVGRINWNKMLAVMFGGTIRSCQWDTDIFAINLATVYQDNGDCMFHSSYVADCCFRGNITITGTTPSTKYYYLSKQSSFTNCYAMFRGISAVNLNWQSSILSRCFVNDELKGNITFYVNALVSKLTDEQCRKSICILQGIEKKQSGIEQSGNNGSYIAPCISRPDPVQKEAYNSDQNNNNGNDIPESGPFLKQKR